MKKRSTPATEPAQSKKSVVGYKSTYGLPDPKETAARHSKTHPFKECSICGESLPADSRFFKKNNAAKDGLDSRCKPCYNKSPCRVDGNLRRLTFKGRRVLQEAIPRRGICEACGRTVRSSPIKRTARHHYLYDSEHPERWTVEVCNRCHRRIHALARHRKIGLQQATEKVLGRTLPTPKSFVELKSRSGKTGGCR